MPRRLHPDIVKKLNLIKPQSVNAAAITSIAFSMKDAAEALVACNAGAQATNDAVVTLLQGTDYAFLTNQALAINESWNNEAAVASSAVDKISSATVTMAVANATHLIHIDKEDLAEGYSYVKVVWGAAGAGANLIQAEATLSGLRHAGLKPLNAHA